MQTKAEKEEYLRRIKNGDLNIIVGTHSLLGSRVVYSNLGLLVVDEEQVWIFFTFVCNIPVLIIQLFGSKETCLINLSRFWIWGLNPNPTSPYLQIDTNPLGIPGSVGIFSCLIEIFS